MNIIEGLIGRENAAYEINKAAKAGAVGIIVRKAGAPKENNGLPALDTKSENLDYKRLVCLATFPP